MKMRLVINIFVQRLLKMMAQAVVWRHRPFIVAITGSVGKTTTKEMVAHVVGAHMDVRASHQNFNNEIGVPLTIIGVDRSLHGARDIGFVLYTWIRALCARAYPRVVIVECGVDRPGDMRYLMRIVQPDVAVVTVITPAHRAFFASTEAIAREKYTIASCVKKNGMVLLNADDRYVHLAPSPDASVTVRLYGESPKAYYRITDSGLCVDHAMCVTSGISFKFNYDGKVIPVRLHHMLAPHATQSAAIALAVADWLHINMVDAVAHIAHVEGPPGRMRIMEGRNGTRIIDDTYNASPISMHAAIATLAAIPRTGHTIAVVGDMLELGKICASAHRAVAEQIHDHVIDYAVLVGAHMRHAAQVLQGHGWSTDRFVQVNTPQEAAKRVGEMLRAGDCVLVKGSQGMRMEKVVEALLPDGTDSSRTLCRQDAQWRARPFHMHDEKC